jgi:hypothetical protein
MTGRVLVTGGYNGNTGTTLATVEVAASGSGGERRRLK